VEVPALRCAVVGCGSIGARHARNLRGLGVSAIALCDVDRRRAERLAHEIDAGAATDDLRLLLAGHRPHAVLVCTPPASHLALATRAVEAGAHVFCEKPLAPSLEGVDALLDLARRRRRFIMMGMCYRFHPALGRLRERLAGGVVGRVLGAQLWSGQYLPDWHPWADYRSEYSARRALGGGVLLDSIHSFDLVRWAFGEPAEVVGLVGKVSDLDIDTEDLAAAIVRLESGAIVEVHVDYLQRHRQSRCEVIGAEGSLVWEATGPGIRWRRAGDEAWTVEAVACAPNDMYVAELAEFIDCVAAGRPPTLDGAEGRATLALAAAVRASAETGRLVRLAAAPPALAGVG
jgi:predicted dehydrogenase